jgi:hypothetical protein
VVHHAFVRVGVVQSVRASLLTKVEVADSLRDMLGSVNSEHFSVFELSLGNRG